MNCFISKLHACTKYLSRSFMTSEYNNIKNASINNFIYLSSFEFNKLSINLSVYLFFLSSYILIYKSIYLTIYLSINLPIYLLIYLSIYLSNYLSSIKISSIINSLIWKVHKLVQSLYKRVEIKSIKLTPTLFLYFSLSLWFTDCTMHGASSTFCPSIYH